MTNIDELVKALRRIKTLKIFGNDHTQLMGDAADAIEALQAELAEYNCDTKIGCPLIEKIKAENISLRAERDQARLDCAIAERNHMNTLERFLEAQERITELTAERDALLKAVEKPSVQERGD